MFFSAVHIQDDDVWMSPGWIQHKVELRVNAVKSISAIVNIGLM